MEDKAMSECGVDLWKKEFCNFVIYDTKKQVLKQIQIQKLLRSARRQTNYLLTECFEDCIHVSWLVIER